MKRIIKENYRYFIIFIISFIAIVIFKDWYYDSTIQYGMSHAVKIGEVPYLDFNMVSTPFYIFFCSIFLFIYDNYITFIIINSIIITLIYFFSDKIIKNNKTTFFLITILPFFDLFCPSYNLMSKLIIVILIYLENKSKNDYLIGFFLGLLIITKHSIGVAILFTEIVYSLINHKKIMKKLIITMIPILILIIYLLITNSLYPFIDLCFLGLNNFTTKNIEINKIFVNLISIIMLISLLIFTIKEKDNPIVYYAIGSMSFIIPICDFNHFSGLFLLYCIYIFSKYEIKINTYIFNIFIILLILNINYLVRIKNSQETEIKLANYNHYNLFKVTNEQKNKIDKILKEYKKYDKTIIISYNSMVYDVILDNRITYFDLPLTGNYGHKGTDKMKEFIKKDTYYIIENDFTTGQFDKELCKYIANKGELIKDESTYSVYYLK